MNGRKTELQDSGRRSTLNIRARIFFLFIIGRQASANIVLVSFWREKISVQTRYMLQVSKDSTACDGDKLSFFGLMQDIYLVYDEKTNIT